jgi:hypothetical protein
MERPSAEPNRGQTHARLQTLQERGRYDLRDRTDASHSQRPVRSHQRAPQRDYCACCLDGGAFSLLRWRANGRLLPRFRYEHRKPSGRVTDYQLRARLSCMYDNVLSHIQAGHKKHNHIAGRDDRGPDLAIRTRTDRSTEITVGRMAHLPNHRSSSFCKMAARRSSTDVRQPTANARSWPIG